MALSDMLARAQAAQGIMGAGGPPSDLGVETGAPPEEGLEGEAPAMDLESALAGVEGAIIGLDPAAAEEVRTHLNAIREIAGQPGGEEVAEEPLAENTEGDMPVEPSPGISEEVMPG